MSFKKRSVLKFIENDWFYCFLHLPRIRCTIQCRWARHFQTAAAPRRVCSKRQNYIVFYTANSIVINTTPILLTSLTAEFWPQKTLLRLDTVYLWRLITTVQGSPAAASETPSALCGHRRVQKRGTGPTTSTVHRSASNIDLSPWCQYPASCWFLFRVKCISGSMPPPRGVSENYKSLQPLQMRTMIRFQWDKRWSNVLFSVYKYNSIKKK